MRHILPALLLALLPLPALAASITAPAVELPGGPVAPKAPDPGAGRLEEYDSIPRGLLAAPDAETKAPVKAEKKADVLPDALGQIPGIFKIPGAEQKQDDEGNLSFEQVMAQYKRGRYDIVLKNLAPMADMKQHPAEQLLGVMYMNGQGVEKDPEKAFDYLTRAAEGNEPVAQHYLGVMYFTGQGLPEPDTIKALMWLHIAILHYPAGPEKDRARKDRDGVYLKMSRLEKSRALELARDWLDKRGEAHLLDME